MGEQRRTHFVHTETLRRHRLEGQPLASIQDAVVAPSREAMMAALAGLRCPFCGKGPFLSVASHTVKAHGVSSADLRDMLAIGYDARSPFVDDRLSAAHSATAMAKFGEFHGGSGPRGKKKRVSVARQVAQKRLAAAKKGVVPDTKGRGNSPEARRKSAETRRRNLPDAAHGTLTMFNRGCRCEQCRSARNLLQREQLSAGRHDVICGDCGEIFERSRYGKTEHCPACRRLRTYGTPEHGTPRMYKNHACRCTECRDAYAKRRRLAAADSGSADGESP